MTHSDTRVFRATSTVLLVILVAGTISLLAGVSFEWLRRQNERTQELVAQVQQDLLRAEAERERADENARRTLKLEARRLRLAVLIETCTVARLEGQRVPRCHGVHADANRLARIIREFRERLRDASSGDGGDGGTPPTGGTATRTTTATRTVTTAPPQGCPKPNPNNPNC